MGLRSYCGFLILVSLLWQSHGQKVLETQSSALNRLFKNKYFNKMLMVDGVDRNYEDNKSHHRDVDGKAEEEMMKKKDRIDRLPGQPLVKFPQYGGYVTVDSEAGRAFFYYFVEAEHNPESAPLLLWLNGGPGCSSLAYGAMQELGPFRVHSDGKTLYRNNYAWNKAANVLFLESPAGVGFSYSNQTSDYESSGDKKTAIDNYVFLVKWMERFPEYKGRDFFIAGESYAGHYVPQLAHAVLQHKKKKKANNHKPMINLKGIIIGNAVINDETDLKGMYDYYWTHALVSDQVRNAIRNHCDFSPSASSQPKQCDDAVEQASYSLGNIDIYNIYAPNCHRPYLTSKPRKSTDVIDPCSEYYVSAYMNMPEVQKALHANVTKLDHDWEPCSSVGQYWTDSPSTMIPLLRDFMASGVRVWIFSGDIDGRIPVTSTRYSINTMKHSVKTMWHPWYTDGEVGGYAEVYEGNLTFTTVRGAGHLVPSYKPARALTMIKHFLSGTPLPTHQ